VQQLHLDRDRHLASDPADLRLEQDGIANAVRKGVELRDRLSLEGDEAWPINYQLRRAAGGTTAGCRRRNDGRVPQEERRPGAAGGTTTGRSRNRNALRAPQDNPDRGFPQPDRLVACRPAEQATADSLRERQPPVGGIGSGPRLLIAVDRRAPVRQALFRAPRAQHIEAVPVDMGSVRGSTLSAIR
jgi:hypothetical protein